MKLLSKKKLCNNSQKNNKNSSDYDDNDEHLSSKGIALFHKSHQVDSVDVYLDEPIVELPYYRGLLQYLRNMNEHDQLRIWIDTPGGSLDSALALIDGIQNCKGEVITIVTGNAASAGSLIALSSPNLVLGDRARFFIHAASYGVGFSKQSDIETYVESNKSLLREVMKEAYSGFLSEEEMELLFIGKDFYFRGEELEERVITRCEYLESLEDKDTSETSLEPLGDVLTAYQGVDTKEDNKELVEAESISSMMESVLKPSKRVTKK